MRRQALALAVVALLAGCAGAASHRPSGEASDVTREEAILLDAPYPALVIEVDFVAGNEPTPYALAALERVAREQTLKRTVTILQPRAIPADDLARGAEAWALDEIYAVHARTFDAGEPFQRGAGSAAFVHALFLDSVLEYEYRGEWTSAIGLSSQNVVFVFRGRDELVGGPGVSVGSPAPLSGSATWEYRQAGILLHEFGHAMGLVDNGIPMVRPHNDPDDPAHSSNPDSIMAGGWDLVDQSRTQVLRGDSPSFWFDDDDRADIAAFRDAPRVQR